LEALRVRKVLVADIHHRADVIDVRNLPDPRSMGHESTAPMPLGGEACNQLAALDLTEIATIRPVQLVAMIAADMPAGVSPQVVSVQMAEI